MSNIITKIFTCQSLLIYEITYNSLFFLKIKGKKILIPKEFKKFIVYQSYIQFFKRKNSFLHSYSPRMTQITHSSMFSTHMTGTVVSQSVCGRVVFDQTVAQRSDQNDDEDDDQERLDAVVTAAGAEEEN